MQAHIPTLFFVIIVISFVFSGAIALVGYRRKPELIFWASGFFVQGIAYILYSQRGVVSDFLSIVIANVLVSSIFALVAEGLFLFLKRPSPRWLIWAPVVIVAIGYVIWMQDFRLRVAVGNAVFGLQGLMMVGFLLSGGRSIIGRGQYIFVGGTLLYSALFFVRSVMVFNSQADHQAFAAPTMLNATTYLAGISLMILFVVGLLLMIWERDEQLIMESEARMRHLFESTSDAMLIMDEQGFIDCNDAALRLFGCTSKQDIIGLTPGQLSPAHQSDGQDSGLLAHQHIEKLMQDSANDRFDWVHQRLDNGQTFQSEVLLNPISIAGRNAVQVVVRDISERKALQDELESRVQERTEELATARAEAETANAVKTRFMDNVSHEMRTPLHSILAYSELGKARAEEENDDKMGKYFQHIHDSGVRMQKLVESVLHIAESAKDDLVAVQADDLVAIPPADLVQQCVDLIVKRAALHQQRVKVESFSTIPAIRGDLIRLRQVLTNLLSNALRYSPENTEVIVRTEEVVSGSGVPIAVRIQVIDHGCGIPEGEMAAIFEPFYESTRTSTGAGGTGLGLALCKSIVLRHHGSISAANRPEGGAITKSSSPPRRECWPQLICAE